MTEHIRMTQTISSQPSNEKPELERLLTFSSEEESRELFESIKDSMLRQYAFMSALAGRDSFV